MGITLTFDIEGGLAGTLFFTSAVPWSNALEASWVQCSVNGSEFQVAPFQKSSFRIGDSLTVVHPGVDDTLRVVYFTPQHGTAPMQSILGFGLLGEIERGSLHKDHYEEKKTKHSHEQT